ncbi:NAD/NADP octopine/nopaline dehydrogenase family protein [Ramlibacter sp. XY19]|uniref:NAD/NADP octopine/nopaline dehydrogenase family protein n=1 Tax=Ramlibacter paludis TaxID=2908000 RepID=UPI0023DB5FCD|nr:NAD/NADP octopine/nopaline dehydrogenase family protein [Ramlibacter paludis]MCG2594583.1 NAD/NADP octopine/nopaline dehydrogenase family protein [Ramlibacter paludis]
MNISILGSGAIALANAAWLAHAGHAVTVWSPGGQGASALKHEPLRCEGLLEAELAVCVADDPAELAAAADVLLLALPLNGHRPVIDRVLPYLRSGQTVIVSSMNSLSALYLFEQAAARGLDITVASLGTTVLTARRSGEAQVRINAKRQELGLSTLPHARSAEAMALCRALFGDVFIAHAHCLETVLTNVNPVAHGPLALFNWTRIERAEHWPQYHYMTPQVSAVIARLDAERLALATAFGVKVRTIEEHFAKSFGATAETLAEIAAELHAKRGGPPGPTDVGTRYLSEDIPFGLAFEVVLGEIVGVDMPATRTVVEASGLVLGRDLAAENDLVGPLRLRDETPSTLLRRVRS